MTMTTKTLHFPSSKHMLTIRTPHENIVRSASARPANTATCSVLRNRSQRRRFFKPRQELTNRLPSLQNTAVIDGVNHKVNGLSERGTQAVPHALDAVNYAFEEALESVHASTEPANNILVNP